ncbi:DNA excision repair protein ERCC-1 isoform X2 [Mobula hypostoma]|uniref:DNA excision repair protein ERCC-1 isoform X2 n=1 Tax=Mobula hypostoma TaxID=723540 RepID=UPI002FC3B60C
MAGRSLPVLFPSGERVAVSELGQEDPQMLPEDAGDVGARLDASEGGLRGGGGRTGSIVVSPRQRGNPVLKFIRNVPWEFGEVNADYVLGPCTCALYLSVRYHCLKPDYIHHRLRLLGKDFALRLLLVHVDTKNPHDILKELARISILADCTLILAWSAEEAGRYLESYKVYENKPADVLKERVEQDFLSKITDCLTTVKSVNRTDCITLISTFKAQRIHDLLREPFLRDQQTQDGKSDT